MRIRVLTILAIGLSSSVMAQKLPQLGRNSIKEVIDAMTLEEKAKLVVGMGFKMPGMPPASKAKKDTSANSLSKEGFSLPPGDPDADKLPEKVPGAAGRTHPIKRLGIPSITVSDGPAGVRIDPYRNGDSSRSYFATAFPVGTLLASTWDTAAVKELGRAFGSEVRDYGVDILLAPALNIHRNPLGGRNFEYYSEDPLVAGSITAAIVKGIQSNGVGTSIKHFAANNQETNRNSINTIVSERTLREIYLRGFEIAVKTASPWTVMSSYNKINGTYASEREDLLTTLLRKEWHFKGFVMTDWFGGKDAVAQMKAGNDLLMPGGPLQTKAIVDAVNNGTLDVKILDANVARILNIILLSPSFRGYKNSDKPDLQKNAAIARNTAAQGMILLRNEGNTLPLSKQKKIALFGNTSYDLIAGGTGSGDVNKAYTITFAQGLKNAGYHTDASIADGYVSYLKDAKAKRPRPRFFFMLPPPIPEWPDANAAVSKAADDDDVAIITLGRNAGEGADRKLENDFYLSKEEKELISQVSSAFHAKGKKLLIVLNIGGVIEVASWRDQTDAILLAWQPGLEGGNAIADLISGKLNPSGKLATSFPIDYPDLPTAKNFPGKEFPDTSGKPANFMMGKPSEVVYEEGIYVGYRYFNSFNIKTAYDFGYGLSYTSFRYGPLKLSSSKFNGSITASVTVTNTGKVPGREVAELYITAPAGNLDKPSQELKAFGKTPILAPGASHTFHFTLRAIDLASYDTESSSWIADPGTYIVKLGASSTDIRQMAEFKLGSKILAEKDEPLFTPQISINELKK